MRERGTASAPPALASIPDPSPTLGPQLRLDHAPPTLRSWRPLAVPVPRRIDGRGQRASSGPCAQPPGYARPPCGRSRIHCTGRFEERQGSYERPALLSAALVLSRCDADRSARLLALAGRCDAISRCREVIPPRVSAAVQAATSRTRVPTRRSATRPCAS